jgi:hypothetical protein
MKPPRAILKLTAVASSALLVAGFVSYRAGAFDWLNRPESQPAADPGETMFPSSKLTQIARPTDVPPENTPVDPAMLSGSKSAMVLIPPPPTAAAPAPKSPPTFIGGSKSIAPVIPPKAPPVNPQASSPAPTDPK